MKDPQGRDVCVQKCSVAGPGDWRYLADRNVCSKRESVARASEQPVGRRCKRGVSLNKETNTCYKNCDAGWDAVNDSCNRLTEKDMAPVSKPVCKSAAAQAANRTVARR